MIKVLHLFTTLDNGGVESFLYNYYSNMDHKKIVFDFVVPGEKKGFLEDSLLNMNSTIYHVPKRKKGLLLQIKTISKIIKEGNYDIIHCHGYKSALGIFLGKLFGIKIRIIHSHMAYVDEKIYSKIIRHIVTIFLKIFATNYFACGIDAAKCLYGERFFKSGKVKIINNAVNLEKLKFDESKRQEFRKEMNIDSDTFIIGNIARLSKQKNQLYAINLVEQILLEKDNVKLLFIGNGEDEQFLKKVVNDKKMNKYVKFLGIRKDIDKILSGLDLFILPSLYEGLPVVLVEAQASGLNCLVSNNVTKEVAVTNNIFYLSLDDTYNDWKKKINQFMKNRENNRIYNNIVMQKGKYDIKYQSMLLYKLYKDIIEGELNE